MKRNGLYYVVFLLLFAVSLAACRSGSRSGGGGGNNGGNAVENGDPEQTEENVPGEDTAPGDNVGQDDVLQDILPEDVTSADLRVVTFLGIDMKLRLSNIRHIGNVWSATASGSITLPTEEMGLEQRPPLETFTVIDCMIERSAGSSIILNTDSLRQDPLTENEVALEINHLQLQLNEQGKDSRSGTIQDGTVKVYYKGNPLTQMKDTASMDISYYLKGAMIELTNYTHK